jgi:hypothetical protein
MALAPVVARAATIEDLPHDRAAMASSPFEPFCRLDQVVEPNRLAPKCFVDRAFDDLASGDDRGEVAERAGHGSHGYVRDPYDMSRVEHVRFVDHDPGKR